jgi:mono/diheme cytochrome c family protein
VKRLAFAAALLLAGCGGDDPAKPQTGAPTPEPAGLKVWVANGCGSCHTLAAAGSKGDIGPNLDSALGGKDRAYVIDKIVNPPSDGMMPPDFGTRISDADLRALADFLLSGAE